LYLVIAVNIALPTMARELNVSMAQITWVVALYLIVISGVLLLYGRLGDLLGKTRIAKLGFVIFTGGSFLAGLNIGFAFLLFARVVQAAGAGMFMATAFGIIAQVFPPERRARAMAINSMFVSIGGIAGPALGGLILSVLPWNYIFWINVPIGIVGYLFGRRALPHEKGQGSLKDVDLIGWLQLFVMIVVVFLALNTGQLIGWTNPLILGGFVLGFLVLGSFIYTENHTEKPLIDLGIFKNRLFSLSLVTAMLNFTASQFPAILIPFYLQDFRGLQAGVAGLIMMAYPLAMLITAPISGYFSDFLDKEWITFIGISVIVLSVVGYFLLGAKTSIIFVVICQALYGAGAGIFQSPNNTMIMSLVEKKYLGVAGSVNALVRNIAFVTGTSLSTIILFIAMSQILGIRVTGYVATSPAAFISGLHRAFIGALILVGITWLRGLVRLLGKTRKKLPI
jgi:EmrB/QacA subfamily drug resistance transporter